MYLLVTSSDFKTLSTSTQTELINLLKSKSSSTDMDLLTHIEASDASDELQDLTASTVRKFMQGVSQTTKDKLRVFAQMDGKTTIQEIEDITGAKVHWAGFQSGITRRVRSITGRSDAKLFDGDFSGKDWSTCEISVSQATCDSLKKYFSISE